MEALKNLGRPPFANYDLVVYFGGGLFALPFLYRYLIHPLGIPMPTFVINQSPQITLEVVRGLTILVAVYILGHLLAFLSSQLIEKSVDRFLGKMSTAIIISMKTTKARRNEDLKDMFGRRVKRIKRDNSRFTASVRALFHLPNIIHYIFVYRIGIFGYLDTRIPPEAFEMAKKRYSREVVLGSSVRSDTRWYKSLEYFVINRIPSAVPRMYNYLVMAGLFRSLSFIFLFSSWFVIVYSVAFWLFGTWPLGLTENGIGPGAGFLEWMSLSSLSVFSLVAYIKFQRRYAEEAIMALAFSKL
ncbi:hypothetical protein [Qipengyuania spongiae]|uniref:Uncharacterized protein n=1 Tax=Qipengyuania spongiae TaxID=2909673 RepID=A0ABY5T1F9_9SPHN|nr:hypothetical protein [Qipengyuania spongiae]UVI40250.1 hypothetical protein L1F33_04720 [Qipengyuania spongiae]